MPFYCIGSDTFLPRNCRSLTATPLQKTKSKNCHRSSSVKGIMSKILLTALIESQVPLSQLKAGPYICIFFLSDIYFCKCLAGLWHIFDWFLSCMSSVRFLLYLSKRFGTLQLSGGSLDFHTFPFFSAKRFIGILRRLGTYTEGHCK